MVSKALVIAFAVLLNEVAKMFGYDVPVDLLVTVIILLLSLIGVDVVELAAKRFVARMRNRGLWK